MERSAVDIVRAYGVQAWTEGRDDWIPDLCADPIIRHDANREVRLSHAEQRARMRHNFEELRPVFEEVVLAGDDEYVTLVWNVTGRDPGWKLCGIEVFRVVGGRITEVWNSTYMDGRWGLSKSLGASIDGAAPAALPLVRADLDVGREQVVGTVVVPAETQGLTHWLTQLFGQPVRGPAGIRFTPGGARAAGALTLADATAATVGLENVDVRELSVELERSGLVNATIALSADAAPPRDEGPFIAGTLRRLSDTFGTFERNGIRASVLDASIVVAASGEASGRVSLLVDDPDAATGEGFLRFGWQDGDELLTFEGDAILSSPINSFADGNAVRASYTWRSEAIAAVLNNEDGHHEA